jgi:hypothetical protein
MALPVVWLGLGAPEPDEDAGREPEWEPEVTPEPDTEAGPEAVGTAEPEGVIRLLLYRIVQTLSISLNTNWTYPEGNTVTEATETEPDAGAPLVAADEAAALLTCAAIEKEPDVARTVRFLSSEACQWRAMRYLAHMGYLPDWGGLESIVISVVGISVNSSVRWANVVTYPVGTGGKVKVAEPAVLLTGLRIAYVLWNTVFTRYKLKELGSPESWVHVTVIGLALWTSLGVVSVRAWAVDAKTARALGCRIWDEGEHRALS